MNEDEYFASFWGHIEDLRRTFVRVLLILGASVILSFVFYEPLISFLKQPLVFTNSIGLEEELIHYYRIHNHTQNAESYALQANTKLSSDLSTQITRLKDNTYAIAPGGTLVFAKFQQQTPNLVILGPLEGILIALKTSLWVGVFVSSPLWLWILARFFLPGLHSKERKLILPFIATSLVFISLGCFFAYAITLPLANQYLSGFNTTVGINLWSLSNYLDYTLFLLMANGIAFESGAIGIFAVHLHYLTAERLIQNRRFAILCAFILAAVLTPPDILTQFMLAIPLVVLYEALIVYAKLKSKTSLKPSVKN